jgi:7-carboxy-7-deazaguanine synthase
MTQVATRSLAVIELFGPTIQGEGPDAGRPAYFVRLGGCDFRCSWCDSMYAVDPAEVRATATKMSAFDVRERLASLQAGPSLVVLTGGNPVLHELGELVAGLHEDGFDVSVETQGSVYRPWLANVDRLVVSPKPPSSGEATPRHRHQLETFMESALEDARDVALKVVVFDEGDLAFARDVALRWPAVTLHLSVGTDPVAPADDAVDREQILARLRWLSEAAAGDPALSRARVAPQLHVLIWGRARGV